MKNLANFLYASIIAACFCGNVMGQAVNPGDIVITEFMANPNAVPDDDGEYIELFNSRSFDISLNGYSINDGNSPKEIDSLSIPANGFVTISATDSAGFIADAVINISLTNSDDEIILTDPEGVIISSVGYIADQVAEGKSAVLNSILNVDEDGVVAASNYVPATQNVGNGDFGSPGVAGTTNVTENASIQFLFSTLTVNEADGTIDIEVVLEDPDGFSVDAEILLKHEASTAENEDFTLIGMQNISFDPSAVDGEIKSLSLTLQNDMEYEGIEEAIFFLSNVNSTGTAVAGNQTQTTLIIEDDEIPDIVINEILADPDDIDVDGNGSTGSSNDEFIELLNLDNSYVDVSGWTVADGISVKFTFQDGSFIPPSSAVILFSKDDIAPIGDFGGAMLGISDKTLGLNNSGDAVILKNSQAVLVDSVAYSSSTAGVSLVRNPEVTGSYLDHDAVSGSVGNFSPGLKADSTYFSTSLFIEGNSGWRMLSAPVANFSVSEILDDTPIQGFGDGFEKNFYTGYDGSAFTFPTNLEGTLDSGNGFLLYFYNNELAGSRILPVNIDIGNHSEPDADVTVPLHSNGNKWNLLGNPYLTAFHMDSLLVQGGDSGLASSVAHIWSDEFNSYILTTANNNRIAPGQGFFIQNIDASSVTFPLSGKTTGTRLHKKSKEPVFVQLALISTAESNRSRQQDLSAMLYFHFKALRGHDRWDSGKIYPLKESYSLLKIISLDDENVKAQDSRPMYTNGEVFHLEIESYNVEPYQTIQWHRSLNIPETWKFTFVDRLYDIEMHMHEDFKYEFIQKEIARPKISNILSKRSAKVAVTESSEQSRFLIKLTKDKTVSTEIEHFASFKLMQNYPNPFNPFTVISYQLPVSSEVRLEIFDMIGRKVGTLVDGRIKSGTHQVTFDARNLASGMYIYRLDVGEKVIIKKMTLIK